jgi:hypothetical protein
MKTRRAVAVIAVALLSGCSSTLTPPTVPPMSEAEMDAQTLLDLEADRQFYLGAYPDAVVPSVTRIRFITTDEWPTVMAACLTEAGFPTIAGEEGIPSTPPTGQEQGWALAAYTCSAQYPLDPHLTRALTDDQKRYIYEYWVQVAVPCMREHGFDEVSTAPSMQTFLDEWAQPGSWTPFFEVAMQASTEVADAINDDCPQDPPGLFG